MAKSCTCTAPPATRHPRGTQNGPLTAAAFRPWRGSRCSAAQDPATDEAMQIHDL